MTTMLEKATQAVIDEMNEDLNELCFNGCDGPCKRMPCGCAESFVRAVLNTLMKEAGHSPIGDWLLYVRDGGE